MRWYIDEPSSYLSLYICLSAGPVAKHLHSWDAYGAAVSVNLHAGDAILVPPTSSWYEARPDSARYLHFYTPYKPSPDDLDPSDLTSDQSEEKRAQRELSLEVFAEVSTRFDQGKLRRKSILAELKAEHEKLDE